MLVGEVGKTNIEFSHCARLSRKCKYLSDEYPTLPRRHWESDDDCDDWDDYDSDDSDDSDPGPLPIY
jgi:hypothetical protein